jgi:malonate-semialdehyde dehydrogenase (acetylating)/methylmalonate-semialdehyde dehydrogenase
MDASTGYDTVLYREPLGVFAGIVPFNFPAMIPFGWMAPMCVAAGNTIVLKAANQTPRTALRIAQLYAEAGMPEGVINVITTANQEAEALLHSPDIVGITFVGSTKVGRHIMRWAAHTANGLGFMPSQEPRLGPERRPGRPRRRSIINSVLAAGANAAWLCRRCRGKRYRRPTGRRIKAQATKLRLGPANEQTSSWGRWFPRTQASHLDWIDVVKKRGQNSFWTVVPLRARHAQGFYLGPTIFDYVTESMRSGRRDIRPGLMHQARGFVFRRLA